MSLVPGIISHLTISNSRHFFEIFSRVSWTVFKNYSSCFKSNRTYGSLQILKRPKASLMMAVAAGSAITKRPTPFWLNAKPMTMRRRKAKSKMMKTTLRKTHLLRIKAMDLPTLWIYQLVLRMSRRMMRLANAKITRR